MTWVKLDDQFPHHPKVARAGPTAAWLYVSGLCYSSQYLTDGLIPKEQVRLLAGVTQPQRDAARLVEVGLWTEDGDCFVIHDFHDYNPAADKVKAERASDRKRKRTGFRSEPPPDRGPESGRKAERIPPDSPDGIQPSRSLTRTPKSSSPSDSRPDAGPVDDDDGSEQKRAVDVVIRAACGLIAVDELRSFQLDKPGQAPPPRSDREDAFVEKATQTAWQRHAENARKLLDDEPHLDPRELASALTAPPAREPHPTETTAAASAALRERSEVHRIEEERAAAIDVERRARAEELLTAASAADVVRWTEQITEQFGPNVRQPVLEAALRERALAEDEGDRKAS